MAKRFTDTTKWSNEWFRELSPINKCAWSYLLDNCDCAGVIKLDRSLADFQIGGKVDWDSFLKSCGSRIREIPKGRIFITDFIPFQCGELRENCYPHQKVLRTLQEHGLSQSDTTQSRVVGTLPTTLVNTPLSRVVGRVPTTLIEEDEEVSIGSSLGFSLEGGAGETFHKKTDPETNNTAQELQEGIASERNEPTSTSEPCSASNASETKLGPKSKKATGKDKNPKQWVVGEWVVPPHLDSPLVRELLAKWEEIRTEEKRVTTNRDRQSLHFKHFDDRDHLEYALNYIVANGYQGLDARYRPPQKMQPKIGFGVSDPRGTLGVAMSLMERDEENGK